MQSVNRSIDQSITVAQSVTYKYCLELLKSFGTLPAQNKSITSNNNNNNDTFVECHSVIASEALAEQVS